VQKRFRISFLSGTKKTHITGLPGKEWPGNTFNSLAEFLKPKTDLRAQIVFRR
jgi:hypothetical protein